MRGAVVALAMTAAMTGCGGTGGGEDRSPGGSTTPSRATPTPLPTTAPATVADRCLVDAPGAVERLTGSDGSSVTGATYGSGPTAVVLLHQTGAGGFCGWVPYARWLGARGVLAVAVDDCLHGAPRCTPQVAGDTRAQVALAVDRARARGATRVAVVGASMGGARALGVGQAAGADAVVDATLNVHGLSGIRIADASIMPSIPSNNTHAATMMIGERAADFILNGR